MSLFFDNLLKKRGLNTAPIPLWKLEITDAEYADLKRALVKADQTDAFFNYRKEIALFYAECWRREYNGGVPSKEFMAKKLGISGKKADTMFREAKNALELLHIPVICQVNKQYFRTLLLQGGIPMTYVQQKDGFNKFKEFLKSLLKKVPVLESDWDNTDLVKELPCVRFLPHSYQNDNIYAVSLQIIRAIEEGRDDLLPYKSEDVELGNLTRVLKDERDRIRDQVHTHPLTISWLLNIEETTVGKEGRFTYSLENVKTIYSSMVLGLKPEECFQFDVFVAQQYVATYKRVKFDDKKNAAVYKRVNSDNKSFKWIGESVIDVKIICDTEDELFPSIVGAYGPNLRTPQVYQKCLNGFAQLKNVKSTECIAVLPNNWNTKDSDLSENLSILGESFRLVHFPEVTVADFISVVNAETAEILKLENKTSKYTAMYGVEYLPWLEKSNYALLKKRPFINVYDMDGEKCAPKSVMVRQKGDSDWITYSSQTTLRPGIIELKVVFPDGSDDVRNFYFIESMSFHVENSSANEAVIQCNANWGRIVPVDEEFSSFKKIAGASWKVTRTPNMSKYPTTCSFEIENPGNPNLKISIPAPYEGLCLVRNDEVVPDGAIISASDFSKYSVICSGTKCNTLEIGYTSTQRIAGTKIIKVKVKDGITPLSNFEEAINRIFSANGFRTFDRGAAATLKFGQTNYKIRYFTLDSRVNDFENSIEVRALDEESSFVGVAGNLFACKLNGPNSEDPPKVFQLQHLESGHYIFPAEAEYGSYVVFSDIYDAQRIVPKQYDLRAGTIVDCLVVNTENNTSEWLVALEEGFVQNSTAWKKVPFYMEVADKYRIPFGTFDVLRMAVSTPRLSTRLLVSLCWNNKMDGMLQALLKMEYEFAMAFHWNRESIIGAEIDELRKISGDAFSFYLGAFMEFFKKVISITLDEDVGAGLTRALSGNLKNIEPDFIQNADMSMLRSRAIGKNSDHTDLPIIDFPLEKRYYFGNSTSELNEYQKTLIHAPLFVYEYTQEWSDKLWDDSDDGIARRRVINFYRQYYKYSYCKILFDMLK